MKFHSISLLLLSLAAGDAFTPHFKPSLIHRYSVHFSGPDTDTPETKSSDTKESEKILRQELAEKNSMVKNEEKYAVLDGERMSALFEENEQPKAETAKKTDGKLEAKIGRLIKPRAYPLFLAEKAAELVEGTIKDITKPFSTGDLVATPKNGKREKIVILGTGWGAASFLKDIDTNLYDVTVISPRNYFLFTPMLAGASVGTVEYRSITQPIREVSIERTMFVIWKNMIISNGFYLS